jgi:hypothetical protein
MSDARRHAITASELLDSIDRFTEQLRGLDDFQRLTLAVGGRVAQANRDIEFTVQVATARSHRAGARGHRAHRARGDAAGVTAHIAHPDTHEHGLADGCPRCAEHAAHPFLELDARNLQQLAERCDQRLEPRGELEAIAMAQMQNALTQARYLHRCGVDVTGTIRDPRYGDSVGLNEVAGLTVAFKALLIRAGGRIEISEAELLAARAVAAHVDADPERMVVELVEGAPPDVPRFDTGVAHAEKSSA